MESPRSPPNRPVSPDTQSWWDLMEDGQNDEHFVSPRRHYQSAVHRAKQDAARRQMLMENSNTAPRGTRENDERSAFWSQLNILSSGTDADEDDTLDAVMRRPSRSRSSSRARRSRSASRTRSRTSSPQRSRRARSASRRRVPLSPQRRVPLSPRREITHNNQSDHATVDTYALKNEATGNIFEMLEQNVCSLDLGSPTGTVMRSLEAKIEQGILDLESPSLWAYLRPQEEEDRVPKRKEKVIQPPPPPPATFPSLASVASSEHSDRDLSVENSAATEATSQLLRDISDMVPKRAESSLSIPSTKYKEMLSKRNQAKLRMEMGIQKRPTKTSAGSESSSDGESTYNINPPTSFNEHRRKELSPALLYTESQSQQSSYLTGSVRTNDEADDLPRSCLSPNFKKRFKALTHVKMVTSHSTASTSQMTGGTEPSAAVTQTLDEKASHACYSQQYAYNTQHAYTAYFERGLKASDCMRLYEHPTPEAFPTLPTEVVVRVEYSSVSTTDCQVRQGHFWGEDSYQPLNLPIVPGVTFIGTVIQIGRAASRSGLQLGDRVLSLVRVGANSRHLCIDRDRLVKVPSDIVDKNKVAALACLPEMYLGAFQALHLGQKNAARYRMKSLSGKSIVVLGGGTLLGRALIELARAANARTVYATGKERHFTNIEALGAVPLNRDPCHWFSLLEGRIDMIVGAATELQLPSALNYNHTQVLSAKGQLVLLDDPSKSDPTQSSSVKMGGKIQFYNVFDAWLKDMKEAKRDLTHLVTLLDDGFIRPKILDSIPLSKIPRAQDSLEVKKVTGFILCNPWMQTSRRDNNVIPRTVIYTESSSLASTALSEEFLHGYDDESEEDENYEIVQQGFRRVVV